MLYSQIKKLHIWPVLAIIRFYHSTHLRLFYTFHVAVCLMRRSQHQNPCWSTPYKCTYNGDDKFQSEKYLARLLKELLKRASFCDWLFCFPAKVKLRRNGNGRTRFGWCA